MGRGGEREGAGRIPGPTGKAMKMRSLRMHDDEYDLVKLYIKNIRSEKKMLEKLTVNEPQKAFETAIKAGRLSDNEQDRNYAGNYMYMCTDDAGKDQFKHIDTRKYIK